MVFIWSGDHDYDCGFTGSGEIPTAKTTIKNGGNESDGNYWIMTQGSSGDGVFTGAEFLPEERLLASSWIKRICLKEVCRVENR